ncbi:Prefoldin subunit-domain-containing protein [Spinellus fusiger]|nr:Prefoldin subunit-domain-containing protein [Spinellus fusiger]
MAKDNDLMTVLHKYDTFINEKLKPNLKIVLDKRDKVFTTLSEYQKLQTNIESIQQNSLTELKTMVDLGSQFYAQAHISDTTYIYVNVGFEFHVQFTLEEALVFISKKESHLQGTVDQLSKEADSIRAHMKMAYEAIAEIMQTQKESSKSNVFS